MEGQRATSRIRTQVGRGVNVPRRFWTTKEEETLLVALEALHAEGIKPDGSLRGGYMIRICNLIAEMLPGCGIEHKHVKSKLSVWRKTHTAIITIVGGSGGGGFTVDPTTNMIVPDKPDAWIEQEKVNKENVKLVRGKAFPWLNRWNLVFGTDRATGNESVDVGDAVNDIMNSPTNYTNTPGQGIKDSNNPMHNEPINLDEEGGDAASVTPPSFERPESSKSSNKRRCSTRFDPSDIKNLMADLMESTRVTIADASDKFIPKTASSQTSLPEDIAAKQDGLYECLSSLPELSLEAVMWATRHLTNNHGDLRAFYGMPVEVRGTYVLSLIHFSQ